MLVSCWLRHERSCLLYNPNPVNMKRTSITAGLRQIGVSYLGGVSTSKKVQLSAAHSTLTYILYLAPANMSGYEVCPLSEHCRQFCLNGSGHNKIDTLSGKNAINNARVRKTRAFFEDRQLFMDVLIQEIEKARRLARKKRMKFAVRLNGTSDLSPLMFRDERTGKNILDIFPRVQFYDYTKVSSRFQLAARYKNYDLTFSFDGHNWDASERFLRQGGKVAVVFRNQKRLPVSFKGWKVVDGNEYDMRYMDPPSSIVGLHYHVTANNYKMVDGHRTFIEPNTDFVIPDSHAQAVWA